MNTESENTTTADSKAANSSGLGKSVSFTNVVKSYGIKEVLHSFSLQIDPGELICLLGPSGCGKSTILRCLAGFETITHGDITVDGESVVAMPPRERGMGMVFQHYSLFPNMTVLQNIAFGLKVAKVGKKERLERAQRMLNHVGLADFGTRYPNELSGGQQQRVALARALVVNPSVLLLDEPLSALDAKIRVQLRDEIRAIQQKLGITAIFVTHDQEEALAIADRVAVMHDGHLEQIGTPYELYVSPATPFVADFIGQSNKLETRVLPNGMVDVLGFDVPLLRPLDANTPVTVFVRPENVVLRRPDAGNGDHVVHSSMFLGAFERTEVRVGTVSLVSQHAAGERFSPGERVSVEIRPEPVAAEPIDSAWARHATIKADIRVNAGAGERQS